VAGRVRARRRTQVAQVADRPEVPEWFWQFRHTRWPLKDGPVAHDDGGVPIPRYCEAKRLWSAACAKWLEDNGLVMFGRSANLKQTEYQRIKKEEPHRVLDWRDRVFPQSPAAGTD
jgi:hypothetical protein